MVMGALHPAPKYRSSCLTSAITRKTARLARAADQGAEVGYGEAKAWRGSA